MMAVYVEERGNRESYNMRNDTAQEKKKSSIRGWRERREREKYGRKE